MGLRSTLVIAAALLTAVVVVSVRSEVHPYSTWKTLAKLCWKNATVRPPLLVIMMIAGWAWVVSVCERAGLDLTGLPLPRNHHPIAPRAEARHRTAEHEGPATVRVHGVGTLEQKPTRPGEMAVDGERILHEGNLHHPDGESRFGHHGHGKRVHQSPRRIMRAGPLLPV